MPDGRSGARDARTPRSCAGDDTVKAATAVACIPRVYHAMVSPLLPPSCRFVPSCSEYASQAIQTHGVRRGVLLALRRLGKCHPWHDGGLDTVPAVEAPRLENARG